MEDKILLEWTLEIGLGEVQLIIRKIHGGFYGQIHFVGVASLRHLRSKYQAWSFRVHLESSLDCLAAIVDDDGTLGVVHLEDGFPGGWVDFLQDSRMRFEISSCDANGFDVHFNWRLLNIL